VETGWPQFAPFEYEFGHALEAKKSVAPGAI